MRQDIMPRRSKLDPYKDQIAEWVRQGRPDAWIAAKLEEYGLKVTGQAVGNYRNKLMAPTLSKVSAKAEVQLGTLEQIATEAISKYAALCAKQEADISIGERNYFRTVGEWFDRIARLRGLYGPQTQVAVQVNVNAKKELWKILGYES